MKHETTQRLGINIEEKGLENRNKFRYKGATRKLPKDTKNTQISMQNPSAASQELHYHPHLDINTSHTIRNPVTQAELTPASLSIISHCRKGTILWHAESMQNSIQHHKILHVVE